MADLIRADAELALAYAECRAGHRGAIEAYDRVRAGLGEEGGR